MEKHMHPTSHRIADTVLLRKDDTLASYTQQGKTNKENLLICLLTKTITKRQF